MTAFILLIILWHFFPDAGYCATNSIICVFFWFIIGLPLGLILGLTGIANILGGHLIAGIICLFVAKKLIILKGIELE